VPLDVTVTLNDRHKVLKDTITLAQFGPIAKVPVHWKFLGRCETTATFHDATGLPSDFKIVTTNQSDENYKEIQASLESIKQIIEYQKKISEAQQPAENVNE